MSRNEQLETLKKNNHWDIIIIGGGASGLGVAVDAISREFKTVLFEQADFAKGTSSKSTKLIHGGVRYLANGNLKLVNEALKERGLLSQNARHLFKKQEFIIPNFKWWKGYFYAFGLKLYDFLSHKFSLGHSKLIKRKTVIKQLPNLLHTHLVSGVSYFDGQFDDARLALNLAQTAIDKGATVLNYMKVIGLLKKDENIIGVKVKNTETNEVFNVKSKVVINASGIFTDNILKMYNPKHKKTVVPSQGVHLVLDASFLNSKKAIMIPKTSDGRVLFVIPWHGKVIAGTTDTLIKKPKLEPVALDAEIDFILNTLSRYLIKSPKREDVLSVFCGLRPLAKPKGDEVKTKEVSRSHKIMVENNLISIVGGKWTTYRKMAEDVIDEVVEKFNFPNKISNTKTLEIHGNVSNNEVLSKNHFYIYGSDLPKLQEFQNQNSDYRRKIHPDYNFTVGQIVWSIQNEMARTVEDVLARRVRLLFLDARAAIKAAPEVAMILGRELCKDDDWVKNQIVEFNKLANNYKLN
ncbi:glycerol-3-phosphate dehydrogenase/oxidase [Olleya sp. AH-315-F22]|nr:glycerol-3-phosphate dehydrogenase/oxidase [Olleya sp. AH-315-F22]